MCIAPQPMKGSDLALMRSLPSGGDPRSVRAREQLVLEAVPRGAALPIVWSPVISEANGHTATIYVATDSLRFGCAGPNLDAGDWDWVRMAVIPDTAQRIADVLGVLLPTDKIADLAHQQANVRLTPRFQSPVTATTATMLAHHADIEVERAGRDGLLSTIGKDWILGPELFPANAPCHPLGKDGAINYGWHTSGPVTPKGPYRGRGRRHPCGKNGASATTAIHVDDSQWVPRMGASRGCWSTGGPCRRHPCSCPPSWPPS